MRHHKPPQPVLTGHRPPQTVLSVSRLVWCKLGLPLLLACLLSGPALAADHSWKALNLHFLLPEQAQESQNNAQAYLAQDQAGSLSLSILPSQALHSLPDEIVAQRFNQLATEKLEKIKVQGKNKLAIKHLSTAIWVGSAQTTEDIKLGKTTRPKGSEMLWAIVGLQDKCQQGSVLLLRWWSGDTNASQDVDRLLRSLGPLNPFASCPEAPQAA